MMKRSMRVVSMFLLYLGSCGIHPSFLLRAGEPLKTTGTLSSSDTADVFLSAVEKPVTVSGESIDRDTGKAVKKKIAAIVTSYFPKSHADMVISKFLHGFPTDDGLLPPRMEIASMHIAQVHEDDIGHQLAHQYAIPLYESIRETLTLGGEDLAVDAVLLIGEHGDYPKTELGQEMTPRRHMFEQITAVLINAKRPIPIYNDKHLSYRWDHATFMYETAVERKIPFWAASALPVIWRNPNFEHALGEPIDQALVIGFHMVERYGFHALEVLQSQVERRRGGETGVRSVQCLYGDDVWQAARDGRWSMELANQAMEKIVDGPGHLEPAKVKDPHVFLIEYVDGLQATILMLGDGYVRKHAYAEQTGQVVNALEYHIDKKSIHSAFGYLGRNIENFLLSGTLPNPVERTYLVTGVLEAAMISRGHQGKRVETPHLATICYQPSGRAFRPSGTRPTGDSGVDWRALKPGTTPKAKSIPIKHIGTTRGPQPKPNLAP